MIGYVGQVIFMILLHACISSSIHDKLNCSEVPVFLSRKILSEDLLWSVLRNDSFSEYLKLVYGEVPKVLHKYDLDMIYRRAEVQFRFEDSSKVIAPKDYIIDSYTSNYLLPFYKEALIIPRNDNEWVEVSRTATKCYPWGVNDTLYSEGLSRGFPEYEGFFNDRHPQPYGCWFHIMRGTGVFVNIGKTIVAMSRKHAFEILNIPCSDDNVYCYHPASDFNFCSKIIERGYDSIQIYNSHPANFSELVFCTGNCATKPLSGSCAPLELRTGWNATKHCSCNSSYAILNCDNNITNAIGCHDINIQKYRTKQTCYFENYNGITEFQAVDVSIALIFSWDRHGITETLPKLKTHLEHFKNKGWHTILVDSGDFLAQKRLNFSKQHVLKAMDMLGFDILPILRNSEYEEMVKNKDEFKFHMLSLTVPDFLRSVIIHKDGVKIGFISYSLNGMKIGDLVQLVIDEALCLKRSADLIVLLSSADLHVDTLVAQKVNLFVDLILGGNSQLSNSCNGKWHTNNDNVVVHSSHHSSFISIISINIIDKHTYKLKSNIIDTIKGNETANYE